MTDAAYLVPNLCAAPTPPSVSMEEKRNVNVPLVQQLVI